MNGTESPQVEKVLSRSWELFRGGWPSYLQLGLIDWVFFVAVMGLGFLLKPLGLILDLLLLGAINVGIYSVLMAHLEGQPFDLSRMRRGFDIYATALLAGVLIYVIHICGFICLCVGIVPAVAATFLVFPLVVKGRAPIDALQESFAYFMAHAVPLLVLALILVVGQVVAMIMCTVGIPFFAPFAALVSIVLCEDYLARTPEAAPEPAATDEKPLK